MVPDDGRPESAGAETRAGTSGGSQVSQFNSDDQWRSVQTFIAAYLFGMLHPLDVFTISRRTMAASPQHQMQAVVGAVVVDDHLRGLRRELLVDDDRLHGSGRRARPESGLSLRGLRSARCRLLR